MGQMARLMTAYQSGALAIQNMRRGGRQTVVVQHVQVTEGGKAVVVGGDGTIERDGTLPWPSQVPGVTSRALPTFAYE